MVLISHKNEDAIQRAKIRFASSSLEPTENNFEILSGLNWSKEQVFFEETKYNKIERIIEQKCTHYIDDLEEILEMIPNKVKDKIRYGEQGR